MKTADKQAKLDEIKGHIRKLNGPKQGNPKYMMMLDLKQALEIQRELQTLEQILQDDIDGKSKAPDVEKYIKEMKDLQGNGDAEAQHSTADSILCDLLNQLGYEQLVKEYYEVDKWYA